MDTLQKIQQIEQDFTEKNEPFDDVEFPEERLLREVPHNGSMENKLSLISAFATFDYNRNASQLVDNLIELDKEAWWALNPVDAQQSEDDLGELMEEIGFRYPSRDSHAWSKNCGILMDKYHGRWHELLLGTGLDAPTLVERLNDDDMNCLKGAKIAPMYARIINDEVAELDRMWELDIPVDTHIRRLSKELFDMPDADDDEIRETWYFYGVQNDINRHIVDAGLWQIGNKWDQWGKEYWNSL